jgi:hypothetical protein
MTAPRNRRQRIADTLKRLGNDVDAWVASASADTPWLVPLSFVWHEERLVFATNRSARTVQNLSASTQIRIALGHTRDVVLLDGEATVDRSTELGAEEVAVFQDKLGSDPRTWADSIVRVKPTRILAWREENELSERVVMRDGTWLQ